MLKLLVPVGHSPRALQAVRHAAFLYRERCASEVVLVNVQPPLGGSRADAFHTHRELDEIGRAAAEHDLAAAITILRDAGAHYSLTMKFGATADAIARCALEHRCDEIVLTAPRRNPLHWLARVFGLGLHDRLLRLTKLPVTAVH
ncbi:universal stress protein [Burkholderia gladioli]|uniref:universal stress protein n=1 Tax=Burkholderia gladioli TaxID=28095 RepID=UPI0016421A02|nr:universal stress protein [Burkholderia gladioli]